MKLSLALFFTENVSLTTWQEVGMLAREVALYRRLQQAGVKVTFVTYGDRSDLELHDAVPGIRLLVNRWNMPLRLYRRLLPWLHGRALRDCDLFKTNQVTGGRQALHAARWLGKPLIARCGFLRSLNAAQAFGVDSRQARAAKMSEDRLFRQATHGIVTTEAMRAELLARQPALAPRLSVVPNFVETERFRPVPEGEKTYDLLFVGRLAPEKNVASLLAACAELPDVSLAMVGEGELADKLKGQAAPLGDRVRWLGRVPNEELPRLMNKARLFVLPSHYEGHPKTLLEAMACGCACLGADSPGIRNVIEHDRTGQLCPPTPEGLREAIDALLSDKTKRANLGAAARRYAEAELSLDRVVELEMAVYEQVVG